MENKPKSTYTKVIGILDIISGVIYTAIGFFYLQKWNMINPIDTIHYSTWESLVQAQQDSTTLSWRAIFLFIAAFTVICAGIAALFRRARAFVIVGSIVASLVILGIPAFILTIKYEDEFRSMNYRSRLVLAGILEIIGGGIIGFIGGYSILTVGGAVYASTSAGALQQTVPSGTDDVGFIAGIAISSTMIYFNPSLTTIERV